MKMFIHLAVPKAKNTVKNISVMYKVRKIDYYIKHNIYCV